MYWLLFCLTGSKVKKQQQRVCVCETKKVSNTKHAWTLLCFLSLSFSPSLSLIRVVFHCILYYDTVLCITAQADDEKPINQNSHFVLISLCYNSHDFLFLFCRFALQFGGWTTPKSLSWPAQFDFDAQS